MQRRKTKRWARRLQVRFWQRGDEHTYSGYTVNISSGGMFIGTNHPLRPGVRLLVEVVDPDHGFMVEGVVAHARRIAPELRKLGDSGMGIRFLSMDELVQQVLPMDSSLPKSKRATKRASQPADDSASETESAAETGVEEGVYEIRFPNVRKFLETYHRDITNGGLFIYTEHPPNLEATIQLEFYPPLKDAHSFRVEARVVQRFEPQAGASGQGKNLLAGMGVEFTDPKHVLEMLEPVIQRLEQ